VFYIPNWKNNINNIMIMRKISCRLNITPDGFCDHTAVIADDELHIISMSFLKKCGYGFVWADNLPIIRNPGHRLLRTGQNPRQWLNLLT